MSWDGLAAVAVHRIFLAVVLVLTLAGMAQSQSRPKDKVTWYGFTSGTLRFPNSNQQADEGNLFTEPLFFLGYALHDSDRTRLSLFTHAILSLDSQGKSFNNVDKGGIGLRYRWKVSRAFSLTFNARYDWSRQRKTGRKFSGRRLSIDAFYYKAWFDQDRRKPFLLQGRSTVFRAYANLYTPGSLTPDDNNVVLSFGGELAERFPIKDSKFRWALFADLTGSWDADGNNYNNKLVPALGAKLEYPIKGGSLFAGARLRTDWRWIRGTFDTAPGLIVGWYKAF